MADDQTIPGKQPERRLRPCPICGKPAVEATKPFCCKRCADVDLHRWLGGSYALPSSPSDDDLDGAFDDEHS